MGCIGDCNSYWTLSVCLTVALLRNVNPVYMELKSVLAVTETPGVLGQNGSSQTYEFVLTSRLATIKLRGISLVTRTKQLKL